MTGASRNVGSNPRLMLAKRAIARLHLPGQIQSLRRQIARALDQRLESGLVLARNRHLRAELIPRRTELVVNLAARRVQLGGELVFDQRLIELVRRGQSPPAGEVVGRGSEPGSLKTQACVLVVGVQAHRPGVFDNSPVVVLAALGLAAVAGRGGGGAAACDERPGEEQQGRPPLAGMTRGRTHGARATRARSFNGQMNR